MSTALYINPQGNPVTRHSYSSGATWDKCSRLYQHEKIKGYKRKDKSAALQFGKAVEDSIQYYHENGLKPESGQDEFRRIWLLHKENTELKYISKERDWSNLRDCGVQLLRLYEIMLPTLPISDPVFQASYVKEVFPGTELAGLEFGGFVDMISKSPWNHPLLPKVAIPKNSAYRPVLLDLKTAGTELNINSGLLALDPQLQSYSWVSGIPDVAFLWMVKCIANSFSKGTEVTFLEPSGNWTPGDKAVVYKFFEDDGKLLVGSQSDLDKIVAALEEIKGKGSTEKKELFIAGALIRGELTEVPVDKVTKVKIQFLAVRIEPEDSKEAGEVIARQMAEIHQAQTTGFYPKSGGVRFPNAQCTYCSHRGLCLRDQNLVDEYLVQVKTAESDWLDELEEAE